MMTLKRFHCDGTKVFLVMILKKFHSDDTEKVAIYMYFICQILKCVKKFENALQINNSNK